MTDESPTISSPPRSSIEVHIPWITLLKVFLFTLFCVASFYLFPLAVLVFIAVLVAATFKPFVHYMERGHGGKNLAIILVSIFFLSLLAFFAFVIIPALADQIATLSQDFPPGNFFHGIENYWIVPKIYGNRLRLSTLVVLLSLLAGGILAGIAGAIAILPVVASYSAIERIWFKPYLGAGVIERHAK